jgi:myo-inositol-1(or 4)-monophosphatase
MERFGRVTARHKGPGDLVTEADFAAQEMVRRTLHDVFPSHVLIGEEDSVPSHNSYSGNEFRWIVDPLDGTTNYVHRVPFFSVSLALEHAGKLLVGAVFNPMSDECFAASAGEGATLNGAPIRTSEVRALPDALIAAGFPAAVSPDSPDLKVFNQVVLKSQGIRRTGSAALNLAYIAAGRFDAGWSCSTKIWDTVAGTLLIREAGGIVTDLMGDNLPVPRGPFLVAATRDLHQQMLALIPRTIQDRLRS